MISVRGITGSIKAKDLNITLSKTAADRAAPKRNNRFYNHVQHVLIPITKRNTYILISPVASSPRLVTT